MRSTAVYLGYNTVLLKTKYDDKMFVDTQDLGIAPHLILDGNWEDWITVTLRGVLESHAVFFDVGANFGWFTIFAAKHVSQVHAFEPNRHVFYLLEKSVGVNGLTNVTLNHAAVGDSNGVMSLSVNPRWVGNGKLVELEEIEQGDAEDENSVNVLTLDKYRTGLELGGRPVVLKVDVEGFEPRVVLGGKNLISRPNCTAFVEYHPNANRLTEMLDLFEGLNYRMAHVKESAELEDISREQLANLRPADMLCFYKWRL